MNRFFRFAFRSIIPLSLALCAVSSGLWLRSLVVVDHVVIQRTHDGKPPLLQLFSCNGVLGFGINAPFRVWMPGAPVRKLDPRLASWSTIPCGNRYRDSHSYYANFVGFGAALQPALFFGAGVPAWLLILLFGLIPMSYAGRRAVIRRRQRLRAARGLCIKCAYDLRGGHDRCPECGSATAGEPADPATKRRPGLAKVSFVVGAFVVAAAPPASALVRQLQAIHYLTVADALESSGTRGEASLESSISHYSGDCQVQVKELGFPFLEDIRFFRTGKELVKSQGHSGTVFVRRGETLVSANYSPFSCGCTLVAVDLQSGNTLWETDVGGFMVPHSAYSNKVRLSLRDDMIVVWGDEGAGQYVSIVELSSGQLLAQRTFPRRN